MFDRSRKRLENLGQSYTNLSASYMKQIKRLNDKLSELKSKVEDAPGTGGLRRGEHQEAGFGADLSPFDAPIEVKEHLKCSDIRFNVSGLMGKRQEAYEHLVEQVQELANQVNQRDKEDVVHSSVQGQLDDLRDKVTSIDSASPDGTVVLPNNTFGSYRDLRKFVEVEEVASVGAFWDIFSVLVVMTPKHHSGQERANEQYASSRIGTTTFENDLAAAMSHEKPKTLYGSAKLKDGFGAIKSHAEWSDVADCVKDTLTTNLENFLEGVEGSLLGNTAGNTLAKDLLVKVAYQWNKFCTHIDKFYKELTTVSNFSPKTAFILIGRSSNAIWTAMRPFRTKISLLPDLKSLDNKASFIWGILQCHRVMDEFIDFKFQSHPAFVKEMSLFVLTERVDPAQIATVDATVASLHKVVQEMKSKTNHMEDKYSTLKRHYDNLVNDVKMLKQSSASSPSGKKRRKNRGNTGAASGNEEDSE
jgi:archaellum component FlaC